MDNTATEIETKEELFLFNSQHQRTDHMQYLLQKEKEKKLTWKIPYGKVKNEIDYMANKESIVFNTDVVQRVNIGSDHRLV